LNSPLQSPGLHATNRLKPDDMTKIDSDFRMQMRSPVMTGRKDSIESLIDNNLSFFRIALSYWRIKNWDRPFKIQIFSL